MIADNGFSGILPFIGVVEMVERAGDGRIKVRAFGFHPMGEIDEADLPWAYMVNGTYGAVYGWPKIGSYVFGMFLDGRDAQHPIVIGTLSTGLLTSLPYGTSATSTNVNSNGSPVLPTTPQGNPLSPADEEAAWKKLEAQEASRRRAAGLPVEFSPEERASIKGILASEGGSAAGNLATILNRSYQSGGVPINEIVFATNQFTPAAAASTGVNDILAGSDPAGAARFLGGYTSAATSNLNSAVEGYAPLFDAGVNYFGANNPSVPLLGTPILTAGNIYQAGTAGNFSNGGAQNFDVFLTRNNLK